MFYFFPNHTYRDRLIVEYMKQNAINHRDVCVCVCFKGYYLEIKEYRQLKDGNTQLYIESGYNKNKRVVWLHRIKLLRIFLLYIIFCCFILLYKLFAKRSGKFIETQWRMTLF